MPLPPEHVGLIVADTRRAIAWEDGLRREGLAVVRVEAVGRDAELGDWQIGVARSDERAGRDFVTAVLRGDRSLPTAPLLSPSARAAVRGIAAVIALLAIAALVTWIAS